MLFLMLKFFGVHISRELNFSGPNEIVNKNLQGYQTKISSCLSSCSLVSRNLYQRIFFLISFPTWKKFVDKIGENILILQFFPKWFIFICSQLSLMSPKLDVKPLTNDMTPTKPKKEAWQKFVPSPSNASPSVSILKRSSTSEETNSIGSK